MNIKGNPMLFAPPKKGQGLVEHALVLLLVAIVAIVAIVVLVVLALLGPAVGNIFSSVMQSI